MSVPLKPQPSSALKSVQHDLTIDAIFICARARQPASMLGVSSRMDRIWPRRGRPAAAADELAPLHVNFIIAMWGTALLVALAVVVMLLWPAAPEIDGAVLVGAGGCVSAQPENATAPLGAFGMPVGWKMTTPHMTSHSYDRMNVYDCFLACQEVEAREGMEEGCTGFQYKKQKWTPTNDMRTFEDDANCQLVTVPVAMWSASGTGSAMCYAKADHDAQIAGSTRGEVLFAVTNALPTVCALATLLVSGLREYQDAVLKKQQGSQAGGVIVTASPGAADVCTCVASLLAKLTAGAALPIWIGVMCWFGSEWIGSSLIAGLIVEPALALACIGVLMALVSAIGVVLEGVSRLRALYSGENDSPLESVLSAIWEGTCATFMVSMSISLVYLALGWVSAWLIIDDNDRADILWMWPFVPWAILLLGLGFHIWCDGNGITSHDRVAASACLACFILILGSPYVLGVDGDLFTLVNEEDVSARRNPHHKFTVSCSSRDGFSEIGCDDRSHFGASHS